MPTNQPDSYVAIRLILSCPCRLPFLLPQCLDLQALRVPLARVCSWICVRDFTSAVKGALKQHHVALGHATGYGCDADQVVELTRAKGCCAAGGGGHAEFSVRIGHGSKSILRESAVSLLISIPAGLARCSRKIASRTMANQSRPTRLRFRLAGYTNLMEQNFYRLRFVCV